jgi:hypothetical protein
MKIEYTPGTMALGCATPILLLGSFASGFYLGNSHARGQTVDPTYHALLKMGPAFLGGIYGFVAASAQINVPGNLEEMVNKMPTNPNASREQAEGCLKGCMPVAGGVMGTAMMSGATYLGYLLGQSLAK